MRPDAQTRKLSAFHWRGKSTLTDQMGRIKTHRQMLLDATRVNKPVDLGTHGRPTNSERAPR